MTEDDLIDGGCEGAFALFLQLAAVALIVLLALLAAVVWWLA